MADINILIVADGQNFSFAAQTNHPAITWFALDYLVGALQGSTAPTIHVDAAHRAGNLYKQIPGQTVGSGTDTSLGLSAALQGDFTFVPIPNSAATGQTDNVTVDIDNYDVLWLMGYASSTDQYPASGVPPQNSAITPAEMAKIASFMQSGGGVFAVGDHDGLGGAMGAALPRVKTMRKWYAYNDTNNTQFAPNWNEGGLYPQIPAITDRFDSLREDANGEGYYFDDQSDQLPQPTLDATGAALSGSASPIHPILRDALGRVIAWLPDHMHEGEATDLAAVAKSGTVYTPTTAEFPQGPDGYQPLPEVIVYGNDLGHHTYEPGGSEPDPLTNAKLGGKLSVYDGRAAGIGRIVTSSTLHHFVDLNLLGNPGAAALYTTTPTESEPDPPANQPTGTAGGLTGVVIDGINVLDALTDYYINIATWLAKPSPTIGLWTIKSTYGADETAAAGATGFPDAFFLVLEGYSQSAVGNDPQVAISGSFVAASGAGAVVSTPRPVIYDTASQRALIPFNVISIPAGSFPPSGQPPVERTLEAQITVNGAALFAETLIELTAGENPYFVNVDPAADNAFYLSQDLQVFQVVPSAPAAPGIPALPFGVLFGAGTPYDYIQALLGHLNSQSAFTVGPHTPANDPFAMLAEQGALTEASSTNQTALVGGQSYPVYNFAVARVRLTGGAAPQPATGVKVFFRLFATVTNDTDYDPQTTYLANTYPAGSADAGLPDTPLPGLAASTYPMWASPGGANDYDSSPAFNQMTISVAADSEKWAYFGCYLDVYPLNLPGTHHCLVAQIAYDQAPILGASGVTPSPENCDRLAQRNIQILTTALS